MAGIVSKTSSAAPTQSHLQCTLTISATNTSGSTAWATDDPSDEIDRARPRAPTNQRAMATTATWTIMPCPAKRSPKITRTSKAAEGTADIPRQASARPPMTNTASRLTRKRSVSTPAQTITAAERVVPRV